MPVCSGTDCQVSYKTLTSLPYYALFLFISLMISCSNNEQKELKPPAPVEQKDDTIYYEVSVDRLRMRSQPGLNSETITLLPEKVVVKYWGEHSQDETTVNLRGQSITAPWFRVVHGRYDGWVFSGALDIMEEEDGQDHLIIPGQRVGPIYAADTEQEIIDRVGGENVIRGDYVLGEGESVQATYLYPSSADELILLWLEEDFTHLREVRIARSNAPWQTIEGIKVGSTLKDVVTANEGDFLMTGFGWDYGGSTLSWQDGHFDDHLAITFSEPERIHRDLEGDQSLSSSNQRLQRTNPAVKVIRVLF